MIISSFAMLIAPMRPQRLHLGHFLAKEHLAGDLLLGRAHICRASALFT